MHEKVLGILGHPVAHSLSPIMHNRAAKLLGLPYTYAAFDVAPKDLKRAISSLRALGIAGLNLTVPHKEKVIPFLDKLDAEAKAIGAVNTVTMRNGLLTGSNTDGIGFIRSLKKEGFNPKSKRAVVIGAGGSARAVGVSLLREGAKEIVIINRTKARGMALKKHLSKFGKAAFTGPETNEAEEALTNCGLIVQTTSLGMKKADPLPAAKPSFRKGQWVYDIIYSPGETRFLKKARMNGARTINGLGMLVCQGSESFKIWTGRKFPEEEILRFLKRFLAGGK